MRHFQEKLLGTVLVCDRFLAGIVGPNGGLDTRAALIAKQAGAGPGIRGVVGHAAAAGEKQECDDWKRPTHGLEAA